MGAQDPTTPSNPTPGPDQFFGFDAPDNTGANGTAVDRDSGNVSLGSGWAHRPRAAFWTEEKLVVPDIAVFEEARTEVGGCYGFDLVARTGRNWSTTRSAPINRAALIAPNL